MVRRLVRDGICSCVGQHAATSYLPTSTNASSQYLCVPAGTPQLRGQVALHRAQTLQRHVSVRFTATAKANLHIVRTECRCRLVVVQMSATNTTIVTVSALVLESAIVVSAAQMLECLARLAGMPEEVCVLPFLPVSFPCLSKSRCDVRLIAASGAGRMGLGLRPIHSWPRYPYRKSDAAASDVGAHQFPILACRSAGGDGAYRLSHDDQPACTGKCRYCLITRKDPASGCGRALALRNEYASVVWCDVRTNGCHSTGGRCMIRMHARSRAVVLIRYTSHEKSF